MKLSENRSMIKRIVYGFCLVFFFSIPEAYAISGKKLQGIWRNGKRNCAFLIQDSHIRLITIAGVEAGLGANPWRKFTIETSALWMQTNSGASERIAVKGKNLEILEGSWESYCSGIYVKESSEATFKRCMEAAEENYRFAQDLHKDAYKEAETEKGQEKANTIKAANEALKEATQEKIEADKKCKNAASE